MKETLPRRQAILDALTPLRSMTMVLFPDVILLEKQICQRLAGKICEESTLIVDVIDWMANALNDYNQLRRNPVAPDATLLHKHAGRLLEAIFHDHTQRDAIIAAWNELLN